uniref:Uncharacterized protein n=1 Tax=Anguilla anguilla TaxID=7936 RepID=A0A0E9W1Q2_ANGAN
MKQDKCTILYTKCNSQPFGRHCYPEIYSIFFLKQFRPFTLFIGTSGNASLGIQTCKPLVASLCNATTAICVPYYVINICMPL